MLTKSKKQLVATLNSLYPDPKSELNFRNPYELLIAVILSAQCTDKKVNEVTPILFSKFNSFNKLAKAPVSEVEVIIHPVNYFRTKARNIVETAAVIVEKFKGKLPVTHEELTSLAGVGRKTANVVMGELGIEPSFPVDTHVMRVSRRLGLSAGKTPDQVEEDLKKAFPPETWRNLHHQIIFHGRRVCMARNPACERCTLAKICPSAFAEKPGREVRKKAAG
jgi:endonuclease-3